MLKKILIIIVIIGAAAGAYVAYLYFQPHRDVQASKVDVVITVKDLVAEYKASADSANAKYLAANGESKIFAVSGKIAEITENSNKEKVVTLREEGKEIGVACTFTAEASKDPATQKLKAGDMITVKGAIASGPDFDPDLPTDATMRDCALKPTKK
ncbi:hypothetical protein [uncultured Microscilla sp.]|uniref:OB-fold protein n=1 Tax=uncultured Microscilla sp. TaxID=432653 RepID=UPI002636839F|nr:hypothetical protein [uncultured Microscilla sp.]